MGFPELCEFTPVLSTRKINKMLVSMDMNRRYPETGANTTTSQNLSHFVSEASHVTWSFPKMGLLHSWMVFDGKSTKMIQNGWFGGTSISGNLHMFAVAKLLLSWPLVRGWLQMKASCVSATNFRWGESAASITRWGVWGWRHEASCEEMHLFRHALPRPASVFKSVQVNNLEEWFVETVGIRRNL